MRVTQDLNSFGEISLMRNVQLMKIYIYEIRNTLLKKAQ